MIYVTQSRFSRIPLLIGIASCLALSACVSDDYAMDEAAPAFGGSDRHPIIVNAAANKAYVKNCHDWSENLTDTYDNRLRAGHGCAVQSNIAAMIADPKTLVRKPKRSPWKAMDVPAIKFEKID